jgi:hypothetical protein
MDVMARMALARQHVLGETSTFDVQAVVDTLSPHAVFEFNPGRLVLAGIDNLARMYAEMIELNRRRMLDGSYRAVLRNEFVNDSALAQEFTMTADMGSGPEEVDVVAIIFFDDHGVSGEHIYATEQFHRWKLGSAYQLLVPREMGRGDGALQA